VAASLKSENFNGSILISSTEKKLLEEIIIPSFRLKISDLRVMTNTRKDLVIDVFVWQIHVQMICDSQQKWQAFSRFDSKSETGIKFKIF
jgi:hypothetical protein